MKKKMGESQHSDQTEVDPVKPRLALAPNPQHPPSRLSAKSPHRKLKEDDEERAKC